MAQVLFDRAGSTIEAGQILDVSLTTPVTQRATLHHDLVIIQPPSHDHTCSGRLQDAARTNHETVQASLKLGTSEQHAHTRENQVSMLRSSTCPALQRVSEPAWQGYGAGAQNGLLTDDIANGSSNTHAVERWHMLAAALIVG
jgi:hypothetical protein